MSVAILSDTLPLGDWQNFYVIVGSAAAALTGLTFIVITIAAEATSQTQTPAVRVYGVRAFITPTIVHFGSALWLSLLLSVPGQTALSLALCLGATGLAGVAYCARVIRWMFATLPAYKLVVSDWVWSAVLPVSAHVCLLAAALLLAQHRIGSLYAVGAVMVLLLFTGIHNAWDLVAWLTTERHAHNEGRDRDEAERDRKPERRRDAREASRKPRARRRS